MAWGGFQKPAKLAMVSLLSCTTSSNATNKMQLFLSFSQSFNFRSWVPSLTRTTMMRLFYSSCEWCPVCSHLNTLFGLGLNSASVLTLSLVKLWMCSNRQDVSVFWLCSVQFCFLFLFQSFPVHTHTRWSHLVQYSKLKISLPQHVSSNDINMNDVNVTKIHSCSY